MTPLASLDDEGVRILHHCDKLVCASPFALRSKARPQSFGEIAAAARETIWILFRGIVRPRRSLLSLEGE